MLRISKLTDYAILILSYLARQPEGVLSATSLAEILHLGVPTVSKVLKMLSDANLVNALRGAEGGYRLSKPAAEIKLVEIIVALEGDIAVTECSEKLNLCALEAQCTMRHNWQQINRGVRDYLAQFSLRDMLQPLVV